MKYKMPDHSRIILRELTERSEEKLSQSFHPPQTERKGAMKQLQMMILLAFVCVFPLWGQGEGEKELLKIENDWGNAWVRGDPAFLDELYAPEFAAVGAMGNRYDKAQSIKGDTSPQVADKAFKLSDMKARIYGETGIVMGRKDLKFRYGGKEQQMQFTFTDVFVKRDGRWQVIAVQATPLPRNEAKVSASTARPEKK